MTNISVDTTTENLHESLGIADDRNEALGEAWKANGAQTIAEDVAWILSQPEFTDEERVILLVHAGSHYQEQLSRIGNLDRLLAQLDSNGGEVE